MEQLMLPAFDTAVTVSDNQLSLASRYAALEERKRSLTAELKRVTAEQDALETMLLDVLAQHGVDSLRIGGYTLYIHEQLWVGAEEGRNEEACAWLAAHGLGDFVGPRFNTSSVSAYFRELPESDRPADSPLKFTTRYDIRARKA